MKRWIASVLAAAMLLPCVPTAGAVDAQSKEPPATGTSAYRPESLKDSGPEVVQSEEEISPDEEVTAIIVLEKKISPLARFQQKSIQNEISKNVLDGEKLEVLHSYTTVENGFAAVVPYGKLEEIRQLPGVAAAYAAPVFKVAPDMPTTMTELGGLENTSGYQGEGMVIAIVDSGLEISHPLFTQAPTTPALAKNDLENVLASKNLKAEEKKSGITASQVYKTAKVPFAFDYADNDLDVAPNGAGDHGTHVAGIAAANAGVVADVVGVAPQAQILAMKVFSSSGSNGATWADILAAADDAVALGADVINMSLGSTCGFSTPEGEEGVAEVLENIASSGVMLSISAGNEYSAALGTRIGKGHALTQNPDYGTVASPSSYSEPLSIASVEKADSIDSCYLTVGERKVAFNDTVEDKTVENVKGDSPSFRSLAGKELEYVVVPNAGETKDYDGLNVKDKIALVSRGSVEYNVKKNAAKEAGAIGILVYNNEPGMLYMQLDNYDLPSAFISQADGKALAAVAEGNRKLTVSASYGKVDNPTSGEMSDFSSWGVTPELTLKPDLTAPGGNIKSATTGGGYTTKSGTSMSAPFVSGAMALVKQYVEQKNYASTETKKANLVSNLLMSTADLVMAGAAPYSPRKQGAGSVNIAAATSTKAYLTAVGGGRPKVELGDDANKTGEYTIKFEVHNLSDKPLTYAVGGYVQTDAKEVTKKLGDKDVEQVTELPYKLSTQIAAQEITVPASGTVTVTVPVSLNQPDRDYMDSFANGTYIEGFVTLTPSSGTQPTLSIPYMGFYGDWTQAPIIDATDYGNMLNGEAEWSQAYVNTAASNSLEGTVNTYLGDNPYHDGQPYSSERNAISPNGDDYMDTLSFVYTGLLRNVKALNYEIKDAETGDVYYSNKVDYETKSVYSSNYYQIVPSGASDYNKLSWGGTKKDGYSKLENNDKVIVTVSGELSYDKHVANNQKSSWFFPITIDTEEPEAKDIKVSNENGKYYVSLKVKDNQFVSNVTISNNAESKELASFPVAETTAGATTECKYDITGFGENLKVVVNDYACNRKVYSIKAEGNTDASEVIVPTRTVLTEDFEENSFPANGWSIKSTVADKTWYQGTEYGSKMAMVDLSKTEQQNEWLISPAIDLSKQATKAGIVFDFYTNYYWSVTNHHHNLKVMASTDNGANWEQIWQLWDWNQKNEFGPWEKTQAKVTIPDKFQNAKSVRFAFVYEGKDSTSLWLDNVQVYVEDPSQIHTITATAGEGGKIDPSGTVQINDGKSKTFTITPDAGRFISDVKVDGISVGTPTTYTFSKVTADHTIEVTFGGSGNAEQLIDENFESGAMPSGWKLEQTNTTGINATWKIYKYSGQYGLYCSADEYDSENDYRVTGAGQDERIVLPAQKLNGKTANFAFDFVANKTRLKNGKTVCTLEGSVDGGTTWTTIWNAKDVIDQMTNWSASSYVHSAAVSISVPEAMQKDGVLFSFHYVLPKNSTTGSIVFIDNLKLQADKASSGGGEDSVLLDENFDASVGKLPKNWKQTINNTAYAATWKIYKRSADHIGATCSADTDSLEDYGNGQNEFLITPALNLSGKNATMTFEFSGQTSGLSKTLTSNKTTVTLEATNDDGKTWTEIWNAADEKLATGTIDGLQTVNASVAIPESFQKDNVKFAFRYQTKVGMTRGGCTAFIDNVKLTTSGGSSETPTQPTTYTITASAGQGGSITPSGAVSVDKGGSQTFTIKPSDNYEIADVKVDGQSVGKKTEYTFENVTEAHTIAATFTEKAVTLPDSIHEDFNNSEALPAGWTVDGPSSKYYNTWKIDRYTALNSSNAAICTQNIMFKQEQKEKLILPQIKMKSGMALTFDFGGSYEELSSGSIKFTVKATKDKGQTWTEIWNAKEHLPTVDEDSSVEDITGKGNVAIPSTFCVDGAQFAFVFESSDRRNGSVAVDNVVLDTSSTPAPERYGITIATVQNGTVTADKATATEGETVTLTVKPDTGYHLKSLMAGDKTLTSAPYTFTMPAKEVTVSALFEKDAEQPTTGSYKDGTYTGSAKGHDSTVPVTVTVTVENGNISRIDVTKQNETKGYWEKAIAIIEKLLGLGNDSAVDDVTTISGATQSSTAIKEAVQNALKSAEEADGSESNPYVIANIDQLKAFADAVNKGNSYAGKYVVLGANLDLSEIAIWAPIGNSDHGKTNAFAGTFDGKGYTVSHVNCGKAGAAASYEAIGFFGVVSGTVKNLNVQIDKFYNTYSEYNIAMGGLVGILESKAVIDHCSVTGPDFALSDEGTAAKVVGGLVGHMKSNSLVANSWSDIYISAGSLALNTQISVGGICGQQAQNSLIANSASFGSVVSTVMTGKLRVGGLVGQTSGAIYNCYTSSTTKATLMGTDFKADDAAATTAIGHLIGSSTTGAALYDCYYDKNADQFSNSDMAGDPSEGKTERRQATGWENGSEGKTDESFIEAKTASELASDAFAMVLNGNTKNNIKKAASDYFKGKNLLTDAVSTWEDKADDGFLSWKLTGDRVLFGDTAVVTVDVASVALLEQRSVAYGTAKNALKLPETVEVTLSNNKKVNLSVHWTCDKYDGNTAGDYTFEGTLLLTDGITNPKSLKAYVVVKVQPKQDGGNTGGGGSGGGGGGSSGGGSSSGGSGNTGNNGSSSTPFLDIRTHWAKSAIESAVAKGLFAGTTPTTFHPDQAMNRAMLVTVLYRMEKEPAAEGRGKSFADVSAGAYYAKAVAWASDKGIVAGYSDTQFGPEDTITREQLAVILNRYATYKGYNTSKTADLAAFQDADQISEWARVPVQWANVMKLLNGRTSTTLAPKGSATRAEVAKILVTFLDTVKR
ncbi:S8 family serine peptidase [Evtepia sp.]|uniref:S8 family serine peptidase n=1 Tax=Evtepia sp. TaxID=2773933 RepID=UPI002E75E866|nr:S8 family serine peptidase [Evtepia sp.]MEE0256409.1 S8 family serine peptidase [Evtepia sp.]